MHAQAWPTESSQRRRKRNKKQRIDRVFHFASATCTSPALSPASFSFFCRNESWMSVFAICLSAPVRPRWLLAVFVIIIFSAVLLDGPVLLEARHTAVTHTCQEVCVCGFFSSDTRARYSPRANDKKRKLPLLLFRR